jgi:nucleotide-binding universal stress UspA family protein
MTRSEVVIDGGILVGHDGSSASTEAVAWAADHAARVGVPLHVLRAWSLTNAPRPETMEPGYVPPPEDFEAAVLAQLTRDIEAMHLPAGCDVRLHAVRGQSAAKLLEAAAGAEVVVVGRRGAGGFRGLLSGSTADQVVRHSSIPVVVVPVGND